MNNIAFEPVAIGGPDATGQFNYAQVSAPTQASQTLTLAGNSVAGETFTIGARTYTWITVLTDTDNQVKVGASAAASVTNAVAAINATAGQDGILYSFGTAPNVAVSAADGAGDTVVVTALAPQYPGAAGNIIATTETMTNASWGAATLTGGSYGAVATTGDGVLPTGAATAANQALQLTAEQLIAANQVKGAAHGAVTIIPTGATQIAGTASLAARATRMSVVILNLTGSPETCYFGYSTGVNASTGIPLTAGQSVAVQNVAQIFFFSSAGAATIACAEDYN